MVEIVKLSRKDKPNVKGVDYEQRKDKTTRAHGYAHEDISRTKFDRVVKTETHKGLMLGTTFFNICTEERWSKIFRKVGKQA